ncbi:HAD-IIB family hydrolase [Francisella adeliensis]|uniref:HAD-IIB family hydrolase n=1 Tax=Francisella adeliensis TaxID=2007306 RepID=UPI001908A61B|nr:HAD-IIB family hydrolase [Francisella adeliensis]
MYDLIITDLDGTLLQDGCKMGAYTKEVLVNLSEKNKQIVFATGRHYLDVSSIVSSLNISVHIISSNGASLTSSCRDMDLKQYISSIRVKQLINEAKKYSDVIINMYTDYGWLTSEFRHDFSDFNQNDKFTPTYCKPEDMPLEKVEKLFFYS